MTRNFLKFEINSTNRQPGTAFNSHTCFGYSVIFLKSLKQVRVPAVGESSARWRDPNQNERGVYYVREQNERGVEEVIFSDNFDTYFSTGALRSQNEGINQFGGYNSDDESEVDTLGYFDVSYSEDESEVDTLGYFDSEN